MTDKSDYEDILEDNVSDAEKAIRDMEDPDYSKLLEIEKNNKDRKTIKEFLEGKMPDSDDDTQKTDEEEVDEIVEEIENQTDGGLLGSFSRRSLVTGGILFGLLLGLVAGLGASGYDTGNSQMAEATVTDLLESSGFNGDIEFTESAERSGMYYVTARLTPEGANQTQTSTRSFYVTTDGKFLFPEVQSPFITTPINVDQTIQRLEQRDQTTNQTQTSQNTGDSTSQ